MIILTLQRWCILLFSMLVLTGPVHAQFWKKKKHHTRASTSKASRPSKSEYRDAFSRKSSKGPNVKTTRKPFWKSKKRMHKHATSRKTRKKGSKKFFKPKMSSKSMKKRSNDSFSRNARRTKKQSSKGGGQSKGVFRGRKK